MFIKLSRLEKTNPKLKETAKKHGKLKFILHHKKRRLRNLVHKLEHICMVRMLRRL